MSLPGERLVALASTGITQQAPRHRAGSDGGIGGRDHEPVQRVLLLVVVIHGLLASAALAQDDSDGLDIGTPDEPRVTILPRPDSGRAPETPGDPGGWQQLTLLAVIVVALVLMFFLVRRQARRARTEAGR